MNKKGNHRRPWKSKRHERVDEFLDIDDVEDLDRRFDDESRFDDDEPEEGPRAVFDLDRWRADLAAGVSHRERMRQRDLRKGVLRGQRNPRFELEEELGE